MIYFYIGGYKIEREVEGREGKGARRAEFWAGSGAGFYA